MKITVQNLSQSFNRSFDLSSPGVTFGRSPENQIVLPDPSVSISLFQAAIKVNESAQIEIRNLAATPILIGNQSLSVGQSLALQSGSEFICGDFKFKLEADNAQEAANINSHPKLANNQPFRAPTVMPMPGSEAMDFEQIAAEVSPPTADRAFISDTTSATVAPPPSLNAEIIAEPLPLAHFGIETDSPPVTTAPDAVIDTVLQIEKEPTADFELTRDANLEVGIELSPLSPDFEFSRVNLSADSGGAPQDSVSSYTDTAQTKQTTTTPTRVDIINEVAPPIQPLTEAEIAIAQAPSAETVSTTQAELLTAFETQLLDDQIAPTPMSAAAPALEAESIAEASPSIFDDLFSGSGVVPIGAEINNDVHPFAMDSATTRNTDNPLGEMQGMALDEDLSKDPLERLSRDGIEHQQRDIFHDTRPSTMLHDNEQKSHSSQSDLDHLDKILRELESLGNSR